MEKHEVIKKKVSIVRASREDMFDYSGKPLENKHFILKNPWTREIEGLYRIGGTDRYDIIEIEKGLALNQFYKIAETKSDADVQFWMYLRVADNFDMLYSPKWPKVNQLYYRIVSGNEIVGPLYLSEMEGVDTIKKGLEEHTYFVLHKKQLFQPVELKKSA
ncbi:MAG TPA: hypothetical protein P5188_12815 [Flavobacterium sp.]|nr:hypothetical protein [Flavobacterium sp.]